MNQTGQNELEFILAYLTKKYNLKNAYNLQHIGMVLLIFMMPAEVYCILDTIIQRTSDIFQEKKQDDCRWFVCMSNHHYVMQVSMFLKIYLQSTFFKKRSLLAHCKAIHFDLTQVVDNCMRYFMCDFLPLPAIIDFTMIYIVEGVRAIYRYTYALFKQHKFFMKSITDPKQFLAKLQAHSMKNTNYIILKTNAFLLNASSLQVNFGKLKVDEKTQHVIKENSKGD